MPDVRIPSSSIKLYRQQVNAPSDPTGFPVAMAAMPAGEEPEAADYVSAGWVSEGGRYYAVVMIGQAGTGIGPLAEGVYKSWVKITATPEIPVLESPNYLVIT